MTIIYIVSAAIIVATIYTYLRCLGKPSKNPGIRSKMMQQSIVGPIRAASNDWIWKL